MCPKKQLGTHNKTSEVNSEMQELKIASHKNCLSNNVVLCPTNRIKIYV